ncbi:hypothetical protein V1517DRAFT_311306 [Lipomyces orientalis]|uniref:Uncharacterized protein n=1 Tax=Lipomyces orientalis TaxID=1233043 RepID=A0ACC3TC81_9ASCO
MLCICSASNEPILVAIKKKIFILRLAAGGGRAVTDRACAGVTNIHSARYVEYVRHDVMDEILVAQFSPIEDGCDTGDPFTDAIRHGRSPHGGATESYTNGQGMIKKRRHKLDSRPNVAVLLGYAEQYKAYRLYDFENKTIVLSRNVIFNEDKLYKDWFEASRDGYDLSTLRESEEGDWLDHGLEGETEFFHRNDTLGHEDIGQRPEGIMSADPLQGTAESMGPIASERILCSTLIGKRAHEDSSATCAVQGERAHENTVATSAMNTKTPLHPSPINRTLQPIPIGKRLPRGMPVITFPECVQIAETELTNEPRTIQEAFSRPDKLRWKSACDAEYQSLMQLGYL